MPSERLKKWCATKGIVIGLCCGLPVLVALMIFGVNPITLGALGLCGGLIAAGVFSFSGAGAGQRDQANKDGGGD